MSRSFILILVEKKKKSPHITFPAWIRKIGTKSYSYQKSEVSVPRFDRESLSCDSAVPEMYATDSLTNVENYSGYRRKYFWGNKVLKAELTRFTEISGPWSCVDYIIQSYLSDLKISLYNKRFCLICVISRTFDR